MELKLRLLLFVGMIVISEFLQETSYSMIHCIVQLKVIEIDFSSLNKIKYNKLGVFISISIIK